MSNKELPWFEVACGDGFSALSDDIASGPPRPGWHAQFVALVHVKPAEELRNRRWGFNLGALLDEALDRQRLFIESLHYPLEPAEPEPLGNRSLALRCVCEPNADLLRLALVGKVYARNEIAVRAAAKDFWFEVRSTLPFDYGLTPARTQSEFRRLAAWELLGQCNEPGKLAEVQRYEGFVQTGKKRFYLLGSWKFSKFANEGVWRALAGAEFPVLLDILLQPAVLTQEEWAILDQMARHVGEISDQENPVTVQAYAKFSAEYFNKQVKALRRPYILQMRLAAPAGIPEYLPRVIGFSCTHPGEDDIPAPGFMVVGPNDETETIHWRGQIYWLEPELSPGPIAEAGLGRIRKMAGSYEAHALFRLPYPPGNGWPDVAFADS